MMTIMRCSAISIVSTCHIKKRPLHFSINIILEIRKLFYNVTQSKGSIKLLKKNKASGMDSIPKYSSKNVCKNH